MKKILFLGIVVTILAGCATGITPPTNVHQPMTAKPERAAKKMNNNGAIYNAGAVSLFEDQKAREIGDTLTIVIVESTKASSASNNSVSKTSSIGAKAPSVTGLGPLVSQVGNIGITGSSSASFSGKGAAAENNVFTGTITVTVVEVLDNGNLLVSGEKQVSIGNETEYIRLSGVVNPRFVINNQIESNKVADAKIEYKGSGQKSEALFMPWLARFFMSVLPF